MRGSALGLEAPRPALQTDPCTNSLGLTRSRSLAHAGAHAQEIFSATPVQQATQQGPQGTPLAHCLPAEFAPTREMVYTCSVQYGSPCLSSTSNVAHGSA